MAMAPKEAFTVGWPRGLWAFLRSTRRMGAACITAGWHFPGFVFLATEWLLARIGSGMIFVCAFEQRSFAKKIGIGGKPNTVVHNGLWPEEFRAVKPDADAADVLYLGDMRHIKGVDVLLKALALVRRKRALTACLVGDGPDIEAFKKLTETLGLGTSVAFPGRLPTAQALEARETAGSAVAGRVISLCRARSRGGAGSPDCQRRGGNCRNPAGKKPVPPG